MKKIHRIMLMQWIAIVFVVLAAAAGRDAQDPEEVKKLILSDPEIQMILIDEKIMNKQVCLLSGDSIATKHLMNKLHETPITSYYMVQSLYKCGVLNESCYKETRQNMLIHCCL
jgi:hypothetical protein